MNGIVKEETERDRNKWFLKNASHVPVCLAVLLFWTVATRALFVASPMLQASDVRPAGLAWFAAQTGYVSFATFFFELPTLPIAICTIFRNQKRLTRKSPVAPALHRTWDSDRKV